MSHFSWENKEEIGAYFLKLCSAPIKKKCWVAPKKRPNLLKNWFFLALLGIVTIL
ncbi:Hypothetical protein Cp262_0671 [Corynebacterium pseudotuberculosis]|nr:Hypothetical protein Cp3995_0686 [Corynebacterium pseudotuberculosis 3/99-5]AKC73430.1 Hypothetical protein Cp226_0696 [Corynebacterium pseudotuberculosis]AKP08337.2 Hypothetical protein Cp262_0671 [Corynebacterium pseudotuberculosis]AKS13019.1 Hypothetical protein CpE19_0679 [Corynebacterium pseudotuberculosis]AQL50789.1 hypothetical protein CpPA04_0683 [Corynebacterium pseudotuberculosis]